MPTQADKKKELGQFLDYAVKEATELLEQPVRIDEIKARLESLLNFIEGADYIFRYYIEPEEEV